MRVTSSFYCIFRLSSTFSQVRSNSWMFCEGRKECSHLFQFLKIVWNIFFHESYIWSNDLNYFVHLWKSKGILVFSVYIKFMNWWDFRPNGDIQDLLMALLSPSQVNSVFQINCCDSWWQTCVGVWECFSTSFH